MQWAGGGVAACSPVTWGAATGAVGRALGWVAVKTHLVAVSHLYMSEHRLLHPDVLGPPGSSQGTLS